MLRHKYLIFFFLFFSSLCAKPPAITTNDVKKNMENLMAAHVLHKTLSPEITQRVLANFINELDPGKTYLLKNEIDRWISPSEDITTLFLHALKTKNYSAFEPIYESMIQAIHKRRELEEKISTLPSPQGVDIKEVEKIQWCDSTDHLSDKLLKIRALQQEIVEKLDGDNKDLFFQRIKKRRMNREYELMGANEQERNQQMLVILLKAFSAALDPHTTYFTPNEANQFMIQVQQRLFGIGAQLKDNLNGLSIVTILDNGPAAKNGKLKINDLIIAVDNEPIVGMDISESVGLIRGKQDTPVLLTVLRESEHNNEKKTEKIDIEIVRGEVVLEEARYESQIESFGDGVIAHIKLHSFYQDQNSSSAKDVKKIIENVKKEHTLKGVILDLRNNSGGVLPQAVSVAGLFISKGIVASIKDSSGFIQHQRNIENNQVWDGPLVVLTNRASASASEIVAQSLQDYKRALIVGDIKTYGKGSFQTFSLDVATNKVNPKGEQKVTRGLYYTVSGKSPQLVGVIPDFVVSSILSEIEIGEEYSTYPLPNEQIAPHFIDDLSDIPSTYRKKFAAYYKHNLQTILTTYEPYLETLKENSRKRLESNKNYQNFLTEIKNKNFDCPLVNMMNLSDFQLNETMNIMKDLIFLMDLNEKYAPTY